jgi:hypothetical protein
MQFTRRTRSQLSRRRFIVRISALTCLAGLALVTSGATAAQAPVGLGTDSAFAVLGGQAVTNTGSSIINGDLGVSPGAAITGFPPGIVNGTIHSADAVAAQAQLDLTTAYNTAAGATPFASVPADLTGLTLTPGVYRNATALGLSGAVTLDAQGNPAAVFIFQAGSTLITGSGSTVNLINGAQPCNVFWQVGSSATLGSTSNFVGNILAQTSITMNNGVTLAGRALASTGSVTMIDDTITAAQCATTSTTPGAGTTPGTTTGSGGRGGAGTVGVAKFSSGPPLITKPGAGPCVARTFKMTVTGQLITSVIFAFGGNVIATVKSAPFTTTVDPGTGKHTLTAYVTFTNAELARTLKVPVKACATTKRSVKPTSTPGFTG